MTEFVRQALVNLDLSTSPTGYARNDMERRVISTKQHAISCHFDQAKRVEKSDYSPFRHLSQRGCHYPSATIAHMNRRPRYCPSATQNVADPLSGTWGQPRCIAQNTDFVSDRFERFPIEPGMTGNFVKPGMTGGQAGNDGESVRGESSSFPSDGNEWDRTRKATWGDSHRAAGAPAEFGFLRARAGGNGRARRDDGVCLRRLRDRHGPVKRRVRRQDHFRPWRAAESRMEPVPRLPDDGLPEHIKT